ncbi:hypothetical protein AB0J84_31485, partial [Micromonospora arborensis]|uniref:hypothetical protein n=1 Tax=Micromonospora arborensis TaxID=2116518 RepID=UPI00341CE117
SDQPGWAPTTPDGTPLAVVTETLEDGRTRQVSGWQVDADTFQIVSGATGNAVYRLHVGTDADGVRTWSTGVLSSSETRYFYRMAKDADWMSADGPVERLRHRASKVVGRRTPEDKAREFVQHVVDSGTRIPAVDDPRGAGYGLYQATVNGRTVLVRAKVRKVDGQDRVVRARPPLPLDLALQRTPGEKILTDLLDAGWRVRNGHADTIDPDARQVGLDVFGDAALRTLRSAHQIAFAAMGPPHLALEHRMFRSAGLHAETRRLVHQDYARLTDEGAAWDGWKRLVRRIGWEIGSPPLRGPVVLDQPLENNMCDGEFLSGPWQARLDTTLELDLVLSTLVHEMLHVEHQTVMAQWLVTHTDDRAVLARFSQNADVQTALWNDRVEGDPRYPAAERLLAYKDQPGMKPVYRALPLVGLSARHARRRLSRADLVDGFSIRVRDRLHRAAVELRRQYVDMLARYADIPFEGQALMLELDLAADGSVRDWSREPAAQVLPIRGYEVLDLGPAGSLVRPSMSAMALPQRLAHPDRPLVVVSVAHPAEAHRVLDELRDRLPANALVELVTTEPVTSARAVELAGVLRDDQVLAIAADLVSPSGRLVDHFVAHARGHGRTLSSFAHYHTVHATPQNPPLTPLRSMLPLPYRGGGRYQLLPGFEVVPVGERVWIGPAGEEPTVEADDPPVVIGTPSRDTPWTVWQHGLWLARMLASQVGRTTDEGFVRVHRPDPEPPAVPSTTVESLHAVDDQDRLLFRAAFGGQDALDPASFAYQPTGRDRDAEPADKDLAFTAYHLLDGLLEVSGADPAERDPGVLVAALDDLAGWLGASRRELLSIAFVTARAYGIGGLDAPRLASAHRALLALRTLRARLADGELPVGDAVVADLIEWVEDDVDVDPAADDVPVRLMRALELANRPGVTMEDL